MNLFGSKKSPRISKMSAINREWIGLIVSKEGDKINELNGGSRKGSEVPIGNWIYFAFHIETLPDHRLIFANGACFWLSVSSPFTVDKKENSMFMPIPKGIDRFIVKDENYAEWEKAFKAIDDYFPKEDWKYQWSWRTDKVKQLMKGQLSDWITTG